MRAQRVVAAAFALITALVLLAACAPAAFAQALAPVDLRTWRPSADPEAGLVLEPVVTPGRWQWSVDVWGSYAQSPVVLRDMSTGTAFSRPLEHAIAADLVAGVGLGDRAEVGIDLPFFVWQDGSPPLAPNPMSAQAVPATGLGDIALSGKVTIVSNDRQGIRAGLGLAAVGTVTLPTGAHAGFMGDASVTTSIALLGEYSLGVAAARATLGYKLRTERHTWPSAVGPTPAGPDESGAVTFGDEIPWSAGVVLRPEAIATALDADDRQQWEVALHGSLPAGPVAPFGLGGPGASSLSPVLLAVDDRIALGGRRDVFVVWGADIGLDDAYGVPAFRAVFALGWAPRVHDRDGDGIPDDVDQCPDLPEDRDGIQDADGCPEDDADDDGIPDTVDACPLEKGVVDDDPKKNGCPPDVTDPGAPRGRREPR
jgi:OOP family OmpA-OmpF porin